ncbi:MAG TPA: M23 family metallopeptidase [Thermoanaerobaculia bacterium]|nr:M23 family metallopeptidase [Thermoanaerobaculia bacterium]
MLQAALLLALFAAEPPLTVDIPAAPEDIGFSAYGILPFGVHAGDHAIDGHPGWDIEYKEGGLVRAAAEGSVQFVMADSYSAGRSTVQIEHRRGSITFRTVYTNVAEVDPAIVRGAPVGRGQVIGRPGTFMTTMGSARVTYGMTHFQVDDFRRSAGLTNKSAVSPEGFLSQHGREVFAYAWPRAHYNQEFCEPFATNPREIVPPMTRSWIGTASTLSVTCVGNGQFEYVLEESGRPPERGTMRIAIAISPYPAVDLIPFAGGAARLGIFDIYGATMRLALSEPGGGRPDDLSMARAYETALPRQRASRP